MARHPSFPTWLQAARAPLLPADITSSYSLPKMALLPSGPTPPRSQGTPGAWARGAGSRSRSRPGGGGGLSLSSPGGARSGWGRKPWTGAPPLGTQFPPRWQGRLELGLFVKSGLWEGSVQPVRENREPGSGKGRSGWGASQDNGAWGETTSTVDKRHPARFNYNLGSCNGAPGG